MHHVRKKPTENLVSDKKTESLAEANTLSHGFNAHLANQEGTAFIVKPTIIKNIAGLASLSFACVSRNELEATQKLWKQYMRLRQQQNLKVIKCDVKFNMKVNG